MEQLTDTLFGQIILGAELSAIVMVNCIGALVQVTPL
jgi:hypothetical protein